MLRFNRKTYRAFTLLKSFENSSAISVAIYKLSGWDLVPFKLDVTCFCDKKQEKMSLFDYAYLSLTLSGAIKTMFC